MDQEKLQELFEEKYQHLFNISYEEWLTQAPETEDQAYTRLEEIDTELRETEEEWQEAKGPEREILAEYRDRLKAEYDLIEEMFGLGAHEE